MTDRQTTTIVLDPDTRSALFAAASDEDTNVNDLVAGLAARKLRLAYEPTGRAVPWNAGGGSDRFPLRFPRELHRAIRQRALDDDLTMSDVLRGWIAEYLDARPAAA